MIVYAGRGHPVELGEEVGHGGEATVYRLPAQPGWLAKIYEPEPRPNYKLKLGWMVDHPPENPTSALNHASLAWPAGLLFDEKGNLKGYRMPYIHHGVPLLEVFIPRRRAELLPQFDRRYLHRTARNLATAFSALHHSGYVAGDINESNVLVTPQAMVTIIDTDSFQVREMRNRVEVLYPCPVGKPEYTPPELQGKSLIETARDADHDAFGLAALIFQLLMEGSHPFRAQWLGQGEPVPLEKRIARGAYPYVPSTSLPIAPPISAPNLSTLHPWLVELFSRCFVDGHKSPRRRPGPDLWVRAIKEAEASLVCCAEGHFYASHLKACPYCARAKQGSVSVQVPMNPNRQRPPSRWSGIPRTSRSRPVVIGSAPPGRGAAAVSSVSPTPANPVSGASSSSSAPRAFASNPTLRHTLGVLISRVSGWPGAATAAAAPAGFGSRSSPSVGVLRSRPWIQPGIMRSWVRQWLSLSILVGGGQGALAGAAPAALIALLNWSAGSQLNWDLLVASAGVSAGLLRGWQPGFRFASLVDRYVGWKRVWKAAGLVIGASVGGAFGLLFAWTILPLILGLFLGAQGGLYLGGKFWQAGKTLGWEKILGTVGALGAAGFGWGVAKIITLIGFNLFGTWLAFRLLPFSGDGLPASALVWFLSGGLSGAVFGALSGMLVDLFGRLLRLTK